MVTPPMDRADLTADALAIRPSRTLRQHAIAQGLRAVTLLGICAASIFLFIWELTDERGSDFLRQNVLRQIARKALFRHMVLAATATAAVAIGYFVLGREGRRLTRRVARLAAPTALAGFLPPLLVRNTWDPLSMVVAVAAFTLCLERLLRSTLSESAVASETAFDPLFAPMTIGRRRAAGIAVMACAAFYTIYMSVFAIFGFRTFGAHGLALAQYDNVFWNTLHGRPFQCGPLGLSSNWQYLGYRSELSILFFLPFYALKPGPETLLVLRALVSSLGAVALFRFGSRRIGSVHAAVLAICYLLYPPLHALNFEAYSLAPLSIPFALFAVDFADERRWIPSAVAATVAIGCGLEISLDLALVGIFLVLAGYRTRAGAALAILSMSYLGLMKLAVIPLARSSWPEDSFSQLGSGTEGFQGFGHWISTIFSNPTHALQTFLSTDRLGAFLQLMAPVALLPLRRTFVLPLLAPIILFTVDAKGSPGTLAAPHHAVPYVFLGAALVLAASRSKTTARVEYPASLAALVAGTLLCTIHWGAFPPRGTADATTPFTYESPSRADARKAADLADLVAMVPEEATFQAGDAELAHVARRTGARSVGYHRPTDFVIYGDDNGGADAARRSVETHEFAQVASRPSLVLLKRQP
jgi:uncharacterized membrane protein